MKEALKSMDVQNIIKEIFDLLPREITEYTETSFEGQACSEFLKQLEKKLQVLIARRIESGKSTKIFTAADQQSDKSWKGDNYYILCGLDFSKETDSLDNLNFDDKILVNVSFKNSKLTNSRFRNTSLFFCDMRYADFNGGTFEKSQIWWCDLYRAYFQGVIRFAHAEISETSINNAYFSGATLIRKMNFKEKTILQMQPKIYSRFLTVWDTARPATDKIKTNDNATGEEKITQIVNRRYEELELIFKNLSSTFTATGFSNDSNWAYVKGKKAERKVLWSKLSIRKFFSHKCLSQINLFRKWLTNGIFDLAFGYGESIWKICWTYMLIVITFMFIYKYKCNLESFLQAFIISFKNMVGASDELSLQNNILLSFLNVLQTTLGILITGIFGFILGNKIRNQ